MGTVSISWCLLHMNVSVLHSPLALEGYGKQKKGQPAIEERGPAPAARCGGAKEADERWSFIARFIFRHPLSRLLNLACSPGFVSRTTAAIQYRQVVVCSGSNQVFRKTDILD